ncbi:MAG: M1 family aminopeptidase [Dehalococcoidia bacterium]
MTDMLAELFEGCHGLTAVQSAQAADRTAFALPGDEAVWGRDRPFRVEHLRLEVDLDVPRRSLRGVATTTFRPRNDGLREAVFDAVELHVESVTDEAGKPLAWRTGDRTLTIDLGRARPASRPITTVVTYRATPRRGLYFNQPDEGYPGRPLQVWTQGQAEDSAAYFPCFDFPGEKFTTEMLATVPASWFALSNGRLVDVTENRRRHTKTYHWAQEIPHPAYLVTLAAGEFDEVVRAAGDVPVQFYGATGTAADLERAFGRTPEMIRFFADRIGVDYPWAKYATVAVADFIFGGMENTSATTMTDTLLHDARAHEDLREQCDSISAHELAHQWFGDLLTCREWSHGWLNESFATYFDALFVEHQRGHDAFRYDLSQKAANYFQEDSQNYRRAIVENIYREPIDIFDRHLYERGSVVLDMLRTELGDDLWWKAIHHYVQSHRASDVLTHDLQRAVEQATGRNMDAFFQQWVWKGGHPEFKATTAWDGATKTATVTLNQTQKAEGLTSIYRVPMEIGFMVNGTFERHTVRVVDAAHAFLFKLAAEPAFVSIDPAGRVLKTLDYTPGERPLKARLADDPEAIGRIEAAKGLAAPASPGAIEALRVALRNRRELDFVRAEIATALGKAKSDAARDALIAAADDPSARVRRAVATALGSFRDEQAAATLRGYLEGRGKAPGDPSYYVQANAAAALGKTLSPTAFEALSGVLGRAAHNDAITAGALTGLGALRDPRALPVLLGLTAWGVHQNSRRAAVAALGALAPYLDDAGRTRLRERLEELLDDHWLRVQIAAIAALEAVGDAKAVPALRAAGDRALEGRVKRSVRVAARRIGEAQDRGAEVRGLKDEVEKLQQANQKLADRMAALEVRLPSPSRRRD